MGGPRTSEMCGFCGDLPDGLVRARTARLDMGFGLSGVAASLLFRGPLNVNRALETCSGVRCIKAAGCGVKFHMHSRAGPPPGQNHAVQEGGARYTGRLARVRRASAAPDERRKGVVPGLDLVDCLEANEATVKAHSSLKN